MEVTNQLGAAGRENAVTLQTLPPPKRSWRLTVSLKGGAYSRQPPPPPSYPSTDALVLSRLTETGEGPPIRILPV